MSDFRDGPKVPAGLKAPGFASTVDMRVPANRHFQRATFNVSPLAPDAACAGYPNNVSVALGARTLWAFNGTGFGSFGGQTVFREGGGIAVCAPGPGGGTNSSYIRLPKNAQALGAAMNVSAQGPGKATPFASFLGEAWSDGLGNAVAGIGDVNNDGYDDVAVAAMLNSAAGAFAGRVYIHCGGPAMDSLAEVVLTGFNATDQFGFSVSGAGDVNRDGYDDVIVGAIGNDSVAEDAGSAYLFLGGRPMDNKPDVVFRGEAAQDNFGWSVSSAGDVDQDGCDDVIIGAYVNDQAGSNAGKAYLYLGADSMDSTADLTFTGKAAAELFGVWVGPAGDVNGDGYPDVIIGAYGANNAGAEAGRAYIYHGGPAMDNTEDVTLDGAAAGDHFGVAVSGAGDVNKDGYSDVLVGASASNLGGRDSGAAYVFFGGASMDSLADVTMPGAALDDFFGSSVCGAGDVNNDSYPDIIVGAPYNGATNAGAAYIYFGGPAMDNVADVVTTGGAGGDNFGRAVCGCGDLNADGFNETAAGAPGNSTSGVNSGSAVVFTVKSGIKDPAVSLGALRLWGQSGFFNGAGRTIDFSAALTNYLGAGAASGKDPWGNQYVDVPVLCSAAGEGTIVLDSMDVSYGVNATVPDFAEALNTYIAGHLSEADPEGNIVVPLVVSSSTSGRVQLSGLELVMDDPPEARPVPAFEMYEDSYEPRLVDLRTCFSDDFTPAGGLNFSLVSATNGSIVEVTILDNRYVSVDALVGARNDNWTGVITVVASCADPWNPPTSSEPFDIVIRNVNDAPVITSRPPLNGTAGEPYIYQMVAVDGDNDTLSYCLTSKRDDMAIDGDGGLFTWTPQRGGRYNLTLSVTDGNETVFQNFTVTVPNRPPRITSAPPAMAYVGLPFEYDVTAVDDDNDTLKYELWSDIPGMVIDGASGRLAWSPERAGSYEISIRVTDGKAAAYQNFTLQVEKPNHPPRFMSVPDVNATATIPFVYEARAADEDKDRLSYSVVSGPEGLVINQTTGRITWTPGATGDFNVTLKASDGRGGEALQEFVIHVGPVGKPLPRLSNLRSGQRVSGTVTIRGTVERGSRDVTAVQVRVDKGPWQNATGTTVWFCELDTGGLGNGRHTLEVRAFDGTEYSDPVATTIEVDNSPATPIYMYAVVAVMIAALTGGLGIMAMRSRKGPGPG